MRLNSLSILVLLFRRVTASPIYATLDNLVSTGGNTDGSTGGATGGSTDGSFGMFNTDVSFNTANPSPVDEPVRSAFRPDIINSNEVPNPILASTGSGFNTGVSSDLAWSGTTDVTQGYPVGQSDTIYLAENSASQDMCYDQNHGKALKSEFHLLLKSCCHSSIDLDHFRILQDRFIINKPSTY